MNSAVWSNRRTCWSAVLSMLIHLAVLLVMAIVPPWVGRGQLDGVAFYPVDLIDESMLPQTALLPKAVTQLTRVPAVLPTTYRPQPVVKPAENKTPISPPSQAATPVVSAVPAPREQKTAVTLPTVAASVPTVTTLPSPQQTQAQAQAQTRVLVSANTTNPPLPQAVQKPQPTQPRQSETFAVQQAQEQPSVQTPQVQPTPTPSVTTMSSPTARPLDSVPPSTSEDPVNGMDRVTAGTNIVGATESVGGVAERGDEATTGVSLPGNGSDAAVLPAFGNGQEAVLYSMRPLLPKNVVDLSEDRVILLSVRVNANGKVESVTVVGSSGDPSMDQTAAYTIHNSWTFQPKGFAYDLEVTVIYPRDRKSPYGEVSIGQWVRVTE